MPIWAICLEVLLWILFPLFGYYYVKIWMGTRKFNRVYDLTEDAHTFGRVDELRVINRELALLLSRFIRVLVTLFVVLLLFTYCWAVPHAQGLL